MYPTHNVASVGKIEYPKISIVTPSYNQGEYLEATILSVLEQDFQNLEYMIIDGGSTDNSREIIEKYSKHLAYYVSEKDNGQTEAINKGLRRITGDIWGYLCSDDTLTPGTLHRCVREMEASQADVVYGDCNFMTSDGKVSRVKRAGPFDRSRLLRANFMWQPSVFLRRGILDTFGFFDERFRFAMDYEYWLRISKGARFHYVNEVFSNYRLHVSSKTMSATVQMVAEARDVQKKYGAGMYADWSYYNFVVWGRHYYRAKRLFFDALAHAK